MMEFIYQRYNSNLKIFGRILDLSLGPIVSLTSRLCGSRISYPANNLTILIIESHLIGDCVMTLSLLQAIKNWRSDIRLIFVANRWARCLLAEQLVDEFIECKFPWSTYDYSLKNISKLIGVIVKCRRIRPTITVETRGDPRNSLLLLMIGSPIRIGVGLSGGTKLLSTVAQVDSDSSPLYQTRIAILKLLDPKGELAYPRLPSLNLQQSQSLSKFLHQNNCHRAGYVIIHPGASHRERRLPFDVFNRYLGYLKNNGFVGVLALGPDDESWLVELHEKSGVDSMPIFRGDLQQFLHLASGAKMLATMDSGPAHLAAWAASKVLVFCRHDKPETVKPYGKLVKMTNTANYERDFLDLLLG